MNMGLLNGVQKQGEAYLSLTSPALNLDRCKIDRSVKIKDAALFCGAASLNNTCKEACLA